jgi:hypothetical protein
MTSKVLAEILTEHGGFVRDGAKFQAPDRAEATIFASLGQQSSVVERIAELRLENDYLLVTTRRGETYVILYEDVRSLRFAGREVGIRAPGH